MLTFRGIGTHIGGNCNPTFFVPFYTHLLTSFRKSFLLGALHRRSRNAQIFLFYSLVVEKLNIFTFLSIISKMAASYADIDRVSKLEVGFQQLSFVQIS